MNAYVVFCHPAPDSLAHAALARTVRGLEHSGYTVQVSDLYADGFDPVLSAAERDALAIDHREQPEARPGIAAYVELLHWCDTLVLVYPTWWSGQPAMLKGWFDRVWVLGATYDLVPGKDRIRGLLANIRRIVVVTTHGSSKIVNSVQGEAGKRTVTRSLRLMCHPRCRTTWLALYGLDRASAATIEAHLDRIEHRMGLLEPRWHQDTTPA